MEDIAKDVSEEYLKVRTIEIVNISNYVSWCKKLSDLPMPREYVSKDELLKKYPRKKDEEIN